MPALGRNQGTATAASRRAGTAGGAKRAQKEIVDLGNAGMGGKGLSTVGEDGSEFISASRMVWDAAPEDEAGADILEKLQAKAAKFASKAGQRRRVDGKDPGVARFGGGQAHLAGGDHDLDLDGAGSLEQLELQFVREMEEGVESFVEPENDENDGGEEQEELAPKLTTNNVWDDLQYQTRKEEVVQSLSDTAASVQKACLEIPKVKVDNDRLEIEKASLAYDIGELEKEEQRLYKKYKKVKDIDKEKEKDNEGKKELDKTDAYIERMKEIEKKKERELRRRRQIERGVEELEEMDEGGVGAERLIVQAFGPLRFIREQLSAVQLLWLRLTLTADPFTKSVEHIKLVKPLALTYFQALRWQNMNNFALVLPIIPQAMMWAAGWDEINETLITPSSGFLTMSMPSKLLHVSLPILFIALFVTMHALLFVAGCRRIFTDLEARARGELRKDKDNFKYSRVIFNSWNSGIGSKAERIAQGNGVLSQLRLLKEQENVENDGAPEAEWGGEDEQARLRLIRAAEAFSNLLFVVLTWTLLEVFLPDAIVVYPQGPQRILGPIVASAINVWLIPIGTHELVKLGRYPPRMVSTIEFSRVFAGRWANIIIVLRRQFLVLQSPTRVYRGASWPTDACYCQDEVGVSLFWYWACDWAMLQIKAGLGPAVLIALRVVGLVHFHGTRPEFVTSSWMVDTACNQLLLLLSLPLFPVAGVFAQGTGVLGFYIQRVCVVNFWSNPEKIRVDLKQTRLAFSLVNFTCIIIATMTYFYLWVYVSTKALRAPICQIPVLYENATLGRPCNYDAATGQNVTVDCAPYLETACKGRPPHYGGDARPMFYETSPSVTLAQLMQEFVNVVGIPLLAWAAATILFLRYMVQRNYRKLFGQYVDEKRYRLLIEQTNLERSLKKQDRMLAIQRI